MSCCRPGKVASHVAMTSSTMTFPDGLAFFGTTAAVGSPSGTSHPRPRWCRLGRRRAGFRKSACRPSRSPRGRTGGRVIGMSGGRGRRPALSGGRSVWSVLMKMPPPAVTIISAGHGPWSRPWSAAAIIAFSRKPVRAVSTAPVFASLSTRWRPGWPVSDAAGSSERRPRRGAPAPRASLLSCRRWWQQRSTISMRSGIGCSMSPGYCGSRRAPAPGVAHRSWQMSCRIFV